MGRFSTAPLLGTSGLAAGAEYKRLSPRGQTWKRSPSFWTAFYDAEGRRCYRSTKSRRKTEPVSTISEMELASRRVGECGESDLRILAILGEATEKALRHRLKTDVARELLKRILESSTGENLFDPTLGGWFRGWVADERKSRAGQTAIRHDGVVDSLIDFLTLAKWCAQLRSTRTIGQAGVSRWSRAGGHDCPEGEWA